MGWSKGYRRDYDAWADAVGDKAYGGEEGWERIKSLETFDSDIPVSHKGLVNIKKGTHGGKGPIMNGYGKIMLPGVEAFIEASEQAGMKLNRDHNSGDPVSSSWAKG